MDLDLLDWTPSCPLLQTKASGQAPSGDLPRNGQLAKVVVASSRLIRTYQLWKTVLTVRLSGGKWSRPTSLPLHFYAIHTVI